MKLPDKIGILKSVLGANLFGLRTPLACHFSITNRCPWNCTYCGFKNLHKDECTTEEAIRIIESLADMGNKRLHLVGGEPMLRKDVGQLIAAAKNRGLFVTMATTGFDLGRMWDQVKDIDIFFLSFDGPKTIHDEQRGDGAYDVLVDAMDMLSQKESRFWTTTVITSKNMHHIDFILETAEKRGFLTNYHLLYFNDTAEYLPGSMHLNEIDEDLKADQEQYNEVVEYLLAIKKKKMGGVIASSPMYLKSLRDWGDFSEVYRKEASQKYRCWAGKLYCYIDANGDVYPCGDIMGRVRPVNCLEHGLEKAFKMLPDVPCNSCIVACYCELNLMFSLNPGCILHWSRRV